jgi:hypothetical protein
MHATKLSQKCNICEKGVGDRKYIMEFCVTGLYQTAFWAAASIFINYTESVCMVYHF